MQELCDVGGVTAILGPKGAKQTAWRNKVATLITYRLDSLQTVLGVELVGCVVKGL